MLSPFCIGIQTVFQCRQGNMPIVNYGGLKLAYMKLSTYRKAPKINGSKIF